MHRSDGSGTSFIFTDYLSAVSPAWHAAAGKGTSVKWPVGIGAKGNEGVAGQVKQLPGSIGYVELIYAQQNKMPVAAIQNKAGDFVTPSVESVTAALAGAEMPDDFRFSMVNPAGQGAYPISGVTWLLVYEQQKDAAKGKKLVEFLKWMLNDGEKMAAALEYCAAARCPAQARAPAHRHDQILAQSRTANTAKPHHKCVDGSSREPRRTGRRLALFKLLIPLKTLREIGGGTCSLRLTESHLST